MRKAVLHVISNYDLRRKILRLMNSVEMLNLELEKKPTTKSSSSMVIFSRLKSNSFEIVVSWRDPSAPTEDLKAVLDFKESKWKIFQTDVTKDNVLQWAKDQNIGTNYSKYPENRFLMDAERDEQAVSLLVEASLRADDNSGLTNALIEELFIEPPPEVKTDNKAPTERKDRS